MLIPNDAIYLEDVSVLYETWVSRSAFVNAFLYMRVYLLKNVYQLIKYYADVI